MGCCSFPKCLVGGSARRVAPCSWVFMPWTLLLQDGHWAICLQVQDSPFPFKLQCLLLPPTFSAGVHPRNIPYIESGKEPRISSSSQKLNPSYKPQVHLLCGQEASSEKHFLPWKSFQTYQEIPSCSCLAVRAFIQQILAPALQSRWPYHPGSISWHRRCRGRWLGTVWPHKNWDLNPTHPSQPLHHIVIVKQKQRWRWNAIPKCLSPENVCISVGISEEEHKTYRNTDMWFVPGLSIRHSPVRSECGKYLSEIHVAFLWVPAVRGT